MICVKDPLPTQALAQILLAVDAKDLAMALTVPEYSALEEMIPKQAVS